MKFKDTVNGMMESGGGLSRTEFNKIKADYDNLSGLAKYAVSSWLAAQYPALESALRSSAGYMAYEDSGGAVEREGSRNLDY